MKPSILGVAESPVETPTEQPLPTPPHPSGALALSGWVVECADLGLHRRININCTSNSNRRFSSSERRQRHCLMGTASPTSIRCARDGVYGEEDGQLMINSTNSTHFAIFKICQLMPIKSFSSGLMAEWSKLSYYTKAPTHCITRWPSMELQQEIDSPKMLCRAPQEGMHSLHQPFIFSFSYSLSSQDFYLRTEEIQTDSVGISSC